MNEEIIFQISSFYKEKEISIKLSCIDSENENEFGTIVFSDGANKYKFLIEDAKFILPLVALGGGCLLVCGAGLAAPIFDCYRKHKKNWKKFKKCLKDQGITLTVATLICITQCTE
jgi:hypothetical protein